jgi:hypothetical protein
MVRGDAPDAAAFGGKPGVGNTPDETSGNLPFRRLMLDLRDARNRRNGQRASPSALD